MELRESTASIVKSKHLNVYEGEDGLFEFLHPETSPISPLVEFPSKLNPYKEMGVRIWAKMLSMHPLLNNKATPATEMIEGLFAHYGFRTDLKIVESSSLNLASSLALMGRHYGITTSRALVDDDIAPGLVKCLRLYGVEVEICPSTNDDGTPAPTRVRVAQQRAQSEGEWINPNQYGNPGNPASHMKTTGPQIYAQVGGNLDIWCASLGTSGTLLGNARFLKNFLPELRCLGVVRAPGTYVPGPRTLALLDEVDFSWQEHVDSIVEVTPPEAYRTSLNLIRNGLLAGPSSGLTYCGLLKALEAGFHEEILSKRGEVRIVFPICDTPFVHLDNYFEYLAPEDFPPLINLDKWKARSKCRVCAEWR